METVVKMSRHLKAKKKLKVIQKRSKLWFSGKFWLFLWPVKCYSLFVTSVDMLIKNAPPKSDCKHKMVLQIGLYCIVWLFKLFISKMLTSSNIFFESFYFRKSHFLIRCSNPEFTFLNTDIFSNTLLPIFPTFFSNFTCFIIESEEKNITWLNWTLFLSNLLKKIWNTRIETFFTDLVCYLLFLLHLANFALRSHI